MKRVLVVEDDTDLLSLMCTALRCCGYEVDGVRDASDASRSLRQKGVDVLVLDLVLHGDRCEDFLHELARDGDAPATVLYSATPAVAEPIAARYAISFVAKPFCMERLLDAISDAHLWQRRPSAA